MQNLPNPSLARRGYCTSHPSRKPWSEGGAAFSLAKGIVGGEYFPCETEIQRKSLLGGLILIP